MTQRKMIMGNNMHLTAEEQNLTFDRRVKKFWYVEKL